MSLSCFKAYDIRGEVPHDLNTDLAERVGAALAYHFRTKNSAKKESNAPFVVGRDMRLESPALAAAVIKGLNLAGADVIDLGLCGTEEVYFATSHLEASGGVMVTASHNPKGHNGLKIVGPNSRPFGKETGLGDIETSVEASLANGLPIKQAFVRGTVHPAPGKDAYLKHVLSYIDVEALAPLKILANPGNGMAGPIVEALAEHLPFEFVMMNTTPNGEFPNGVPNPLLPETREPTRKALLQHKCDLGLAWDGDFDRCFFFDGDGTFIESYYLVGLIAEMMLLKNPGASIVYEPRLVWNTQELVCASGGVPVLSKCGHSHIKGKMRESEAIYGGEMSAHHYFRDFSYCDSGMIPWLLVTALMSRTGKSLSQLVGERMAAFPCSGEINFRVSDIPSTLEQIREHYAQETPKEDSLDGLSLSFADWRLNLRASNTEPLLRLNIEARNNADLVAIRLAEISALIENKAKL